MPSLAILVSAVLVLSCGQTDRITEADQCYTVLRVPVSITITLYWLMRIVCDNDWMSSTMTASSPLMIQHDGQQAVAAVVGLKMKYSTFYEHFVNATTSCGRTLSGDSCNFTCRSPVSCVCVVNL